MCSQSLHDSSKSHSTNQPVCGSSLWIQFQLRVALRLEATQDLSTFTSLWRCGTGERGNWIYQDILSYSESYITSYNTPIIITAIFPPGDDGETPVFWKGMLILSGGSPPFWASTLGPGAEQSHQGAASFWAMFQLKWASLSIWLAMLPQYKLRIYVLRFIYVSKSDRNMISLNMGHCQFQYILLIKIIKTTIFLGYTAFSGLPENWKLIQSW